MFSLVSLDSSDDILEDYFVPIDYRMHDAEILLRIDTIEGYEKAIEYLWCLLKDYDSSQFCLFMKTRINPLLEKTFDKTTHNQTLQSIKLSLYIHYLLASGESERLDLLAEVRSEFKNYSLSHWLPNGFELLFRSNLNHAKVTEIIAFLFVGDLNDTWTKRLDILFHHTDYLNHPKFFFGMIQFILRTGKTEGFTHSQARSFCLLLRTQEISFFDCIQILDLFRGGAIEIICLEKISSNKKVSSVEFILLLTKILPTIDKNDQEQLVALSQKEFLCDEDEHAYNNLDLLRLLTVSRLRRITSFFNSEINSIKERAYLNFIKSIIYDWNVHVSRYAFVWNTDLNRWDFTKIKTFLKLFNDFRLNNSFSYLDHQTKLMVFICAEKIQKLMRQHGIDHPKIICRIGNVFCVDDTWAEGAIAFFIKNGQEKIAQSISLILEKLVPQDEEKLFLFLKSLKNIMQKQLFQDVHNQDFIAVFMEIMKMYANYSRILSSKEFKSEVVNELRVVFRLNELSFSHRFWIANFLRLYQHPLNKEDTQKLIGSFIEEKGPFTDSDIIKVLDILNFSQVNPLDGIDPEIVDEIIGKKFYFDEKKTGRWNRLGPNDATRREILELKEAVSHFLKRWNANEHHMILLYHNYIEAIHIICLESHRMDLEYNERLKVIDVTSKTQGNIHKEAKKILIQRQLAALDDPIQEPKNKKIYKISPSLRRVPSLKRREMVLAAFSKRPLIRFLSSLSHSFKEDIEDLEEGHVED